jgi:flagellar FliL protein
MPIEQRVISQKIGSRPAAPAPAVPEPRPEAGAPDAKPKRGGRKRLVVVIVVAVLLVVAGAAAYLLLGRGEPDGAASAPPPEPIPVAGEVLSVESVSVNLASGHYLRLGMALQLTAEAETPDPAKALDLAIALYSGRPIAEVTDPVTREALKDQLLVQLVEAYEGQVMDLYLTDYVTQ